MVSEPKQAPPVVRTKLYRTPQARRAEGRQALLFVYGLVDSEQRDHASKHLHELHDKVNTFLGTAGP